MRGATRLNGAMWQRSLLRRTIPDSRQVDIAGWVATQYVRQRQPSPPPPPPPGGAPGQMVESTAPSLSALAINDFWTFVLTNLKGDGAGGFRTKLPVLRAVGWRYIAGIGYIQDN